MLFHSQSVNADLSSDNPHPVCVMLFHSQSVNADLSSDNSHPVCVMLFHSQSVNVDLSSDNSHPVCVMLFHSQSVNADLSSDTRAILEEVTRCLNLEKLLPCYRHTVTVRYEFKQYLFQIIHIYNYMVTCTGILT